MVEAPMGLAFGLRLLVQPDGCRTGNPGIQFDASGRCSEPGNVADDRIADSCWNITGINISCSSMEQASARWIALPSRHNHRIGLFRKRLALEVACYGPAYEACCTKQ